MKESERKRQYLAEQLTRKLCELGYPYAFGDTIAKELRTEKALARMLGYLKQGKPSSAEEIVDEMLAIEADRNAWRQKKIAEHANGQYNRLLAQGLDEKDEED
jgi:uncharacterized membrane-anchored protein